MAIYDFFVSRNNSVSNTAAYVGHQGRLFYDSDNGVIKISDGVTPGGVFIPYNIATTETIGGIKAGPGANVSLDGTLTIDTTGLPLGIGNLQVTDTTLKTVTINDDLIIESSGTGNISLVGNVLFHPTNGPTLTDPYFKASDDGQITILVPSTDPLAGAVKIIGSSSGNVSPPVNTGVMLHITGNNDDASRLYNDAIGSFAAFVGRRINGNISSPTAVLAGDEIIRISSTGYNGTSVSGGGSARIVFQAAENFSPGAFGGNISLWACPIGSNVLSKIATIDAASGLTATKSTIQGNLTVNGNIVGNVTTTTASIGSVNVSGNIAYSVSTNNATATQLTSKSTAVTCDGRTGQITTSSSSIAKGEAVTFTVNNSYVTEVTDVPIVVFQNGATANSYSVAVTRVQVGSFNITITNNGTGPLADTIIINFAIIKVQ